LAYGTLVGMVREGKFLSHDTDVDVIMMENDVDGLVDVLKDSGLRIERIIHNNFGDVLVSSSLPKIDAHLDACIYLKEKDFYRFPFVYPLSDRYDVSISHMRTEKATFLGKEYQVPIDREQVIEKWYGKDWRIPRITPPQRAHLREKFIQKNDEKKE